MGDGAQENVSEVNDRRADVAAAFESFNIRDVDNEAPTDEDNNSESVNGEVSERKRDDKGRFLAQDASVEESSDEEVVSQEDEVSETDLEESAAPDETDTPKELADKESDSPKEEESASPSQYAFPDSWNADLSEKWNSLDPTVQQQILKREQDIYSGIEGYRDKARAYEKFETVISPYRATLNSLGLPPEQAIERLMNADHMLRTSDPVAKQHLLVRMAKQYGISLDSLPAEENSEMLEVKQQMMQLQHQIASHQQQVQETQYDPYVNEVENFRNNPEFSRFEEVRPVMAALLENGQSSGLKDAYQAALKTLPDYQEKSISDQKRKWALQEQKRAKKAKAAASSVKGSPPRSAPKADPTDLRALLSEGFSGI